MNIKLKQLYKNYSFFKSNHIINPPNTYFNFLQFFFELL